MPNTAGTGTRPGSECGDGSGRGSEKQSSESSLDCRWTRILDCSPEARSYRYLIEGAPLPVTNNTGVFAVEAANGPSRVVLESSFQPLDPAMEHQLSEMWEPYLPATLANLKHLIEESVPKRS